jgi:hypothetical protein
MTLLACSLRQMDALVTADGRSIESRGKIVTRIRDDFQKLFPVPSQPVVIAEHGQNSFDGHTVSDWIRQFCDRLTPGLSIPQIGDHLREFLHPIVRHTLQDDNNAAGCWIVGFGRGEDVPEHVEIFWKWEGPEFVVRENHWRPTDILLGGSGSIGLRADIRRIESASVETVRAMHADLFTRSMNIPRNPQVVGGQIHELLITPHGWEWTLPPPEKQ